MSIVEMCFILDYLCSEFKEPAIYWQDPEFILESEDVVLFKLEG